MPRAYTIAATALALGVTHKWVDNALSHYTVSGVQQGGRGVHRRISTEGVFELFVAQMLVGRLGVTLENAIHLGRLLSLSGELQILPELQLTLDVTSVRINLEQKLELAVEAAPMPKRVRPPGKTKRGARIRRPAYVLVDSESL